MQFAGAALPLAVLLALIACLLVASSIGQLAKEIPSAGGLYSYVTHGARADAGLLVGLDLPLLRSRSSPRSSS